MYRISKQFEFSASHQLSQLPSTHPCSRMHGHNYVVTFILKSETVNANGFVLDYRDLDPVKKWLDEHFDHQHLNDAMPYPPTAENIARYLFEVFSPVYANLCEVLVSETSKTSAGYRL